jgi:SAM-dependent methyltransferase
MAKPSNPHTSMTAHQESLLKAAYGAQTTQILYIAAKLGIADQLQNGHLSAMELANSIGVDTSALLRILRGLVSIGICIENTNGKFGITSEGTYLSSDHPDTIRPRLLLNGEVHYALWSEMLATVRTGESTSQHRFGMPFYDYLASNPDAGALFDQAMASAVQYRHRPVVDAYDFGKFSKIVDVGGGNGALMVEIMTTHPQPTGIVFDVPRIAASAQELFEAASLNARCRFIGGDALKGVPSGGDAYILSAVVSGWEDEEAVVVLKHCRKHLAPQGKLLLVDWIMPAADEPRDGFRFWDTVITDLIMLATAGRHGRIRTIAEFQTLLDSSDFTRTALMPTQSSMWIIEAVPSERSSYIGLSEKASSSA